MVAFLGIIQLGVIGTNCIYELKRKSTAVFLWAVLLVMFGIPHMFSTVSGIYQYSTYTMKEASIFVILFGSMYFLSKYLWVKKTNNNYQKKLEEKLKNEEHEYHISKFTRILFVIMLVVIAVRISMNIKQAGSLFNITWSTIRETSASNSMSNVFIPLFFASSSCIILAIKQNNKKLIILSMIVVLIDVLISKNRIEILPIFVGIIYWFILKKKKISIREIVILGMVGIIAIYIIYALRAIRHIGSINNLIENYTIKSFNESVMTYFEQNSGELGLREHMYYFIENNNNFKDFGEGNTYKRMLLVLIPTRWSLGIKPSDFAIAMGKAVLPSSNGYSVHPTLFGDVYANFGFYGFIFGIFWSAFTSVIDKIIQRKNEVLYLPFGFNFAIAYIIEARGSVYNGFVWSVYSSFILIFIYTVFRLVAKGKNEKQK